MTLKFVIVLQAVLLVAAVVLAVVAFRGAKSIIFVLLKWAMVCYVIQHLAPFLVGLFYWTRGPKNAAVMMAWWHSWWLLVSQTVDCLFLVIIIAALVCFIRDKRLPTEGA